MTRGRQSAPTYTPRPGLLSWWLLCLVVALSGAACGAAPRSANHNATPPPHQSRLARLLEPIRKKYDLPALGALIMVNGKIVATDVVGVRKYGGHVRATVNDQFHLGSDTKAMTATLAAMLVDQGVVAWDTTLEKLFPKLAPTMAKGYRNVTLEQLLRHLGGTPQSLAGTAAWRRLWTSHAPLRQQRYELARTILSAPRAVAPGSFAYSNTGYIIAGAALERLTNTPWEQLIQTRLFAPLGMTSCGFGAPATPGKQDQPWGHRGDKPVSRGPGDDNPAALGPAGTVHCSLRDWAKFVALHLAALRGHPRLVSAKSLARMHTPSPNTHYGMGWGVVSDPKGKPVLTHDGSNTMWYARAVVLARTNRVLLIVTNRGDRAAAHAVQQATRTVARAFPGTGDKDAAPPATQSE